MTPEQKQIAIAEFDGISIEEYRMEEGCINTSALPRYLTSRDAICGAVARLDSHQGAQFVSHLAQVQGWTYEHASTFSDSIFSLITATPTQLSDALLLTLGYEL